MATIRNAGTLDFFTAPSSSSLHKVLFAGNKTLLHLHRNRKKRLFQHHLGCFNGSFPPPASSSFSSRGGGLFFSISASLQNNLSEAESVPLSEGLSNVPASPGIYAVYDKEGELQYLGLTRRLSASLSNHARDLPDLCATAKFSVIDAPEKQALVDAWKQWMEEHIGLTGKLPPGNEAGNTTWTAKKPRRAKPDIWLTPGPNMKLTIPLEELVDKIVKENKVVAFIKGSRTTPQCGFSHRVLTLLNENGIDYETVNVLDEEHNAGLREALKVYSQWPTIPQVFAHGEFVGGADIMDELASSGKIKATFQKSS